MKNYLILLKNHEKSKEFSQVALSSAKNFNWTIEIFDAINGHEFALSDFNIFPTKISKKCNRAFDRPGVVGCFLSHYNLWLKCLKLNEPIGIFEHDVIFQKSYLNSIKFVEVLRLDKLSKGKDHGTGFWWEGSHAYFITPVGAKKLLSWTVNNGAWPVDVILGSKVVNIEFDDNNLIMLNNLSKQFSLTRNF